MLELSDMAVSGFFGLLGGVVLGMAARLGRFCTLGAIEDALYANDFRRARMWGVALFVGILGVYALTASGQFDTAETVYARTAWNPLASVFGGAVFGYGMALSGHCGYGALARMAGGDLRSFVIIVVMGVSAYMTLTGPLASMRLAIFPIEVSSDPQQLESIAVTAASATDLPSGLIAIAIASGFLAWALWSKEFRSAPRQVYWGAMVGLAIVSGWWGTAHIAETGFDAIAVESHTFTAPLGETILYAMTSAGGGVGFSIGSVAGVVIGAFLGSLWLGHFRWEACDDPRELRRQIFGAALMGIGGVVAMGCSIGQGLTAFSTLAWSAPVVGLSIVGGAALGLRHLIEGWRPPVGFLIGRSGSNTSSR